jgi:hypothetical protein
MPNSLRDLVVRVVAQRLKAWAEAVLAEAGEAEPSAAPVTSRVAAPRVAVSLAPAPLEPEEQEFSEGPPAQWLRDAQALHGGPPEDWLKYSRRRPAVPAPAPEPVTELPAEVSREVEAEVERAEPSLVPAEWKESAPRPPPARGEWPVLPSAPAGRERFEWQPVISRVERPAGSAPSEATASPVARPPLPPEPWVVPLPSRPMTSAEPWVVEVAATLPSLGEEPVPTRASGPVAFSAEPFQPAPARRSEPTPLVEALAPLPSGPHAPARNVLALVPAPRELASPEEEEPSPGWPALPSRETGSVSQKATGPSEEQERWPWPELPESSAAEPSEGAALLLSWDRLLRLDREQRGE